MGGGGGGGVGGGSGKGGGCHKPVFLIQRDFNFCCQIALCGCHLFLKLFANRSFGLVSIMA